MEPLRMASFTYEQKTKISVSRFMDFLINLFFFLVLFPYVTFGLPSISDSQPWAALAGAFIVLLFMLVPRKQGVSKSIFAIWIISLCCIANLTVFYLFDGGESIMYLRSIYKYVTWAFIIPPVVLYLDNFRIGVFKTSVFLWFIISTLQLILKRPIVGFILPRASYSLSRHWVLGFAPEPGYMAKVAVFFLILIDYFILSGKIESKSAMLMRYMCYWMIFISFSLTGLFLLIAYLFCRVIIVLSEKPIFSIRNLILLLLLVTTLLVVGPVVYEVIFDYVSNLSRLGHFLVSLTNKGVIDSLMTDASFVARFSQIFLSIQTITSEEIFGSGVPNNPIGSIFSPVYDSGIYGVALIVFLLFVFLRGIFYAKSKNYRVYSFELFLIFVLLTFSESLASAYIPFIVGIVLHLHSGKRVIEYREEATFRRAITHSPYEVFGEKLVK